MYFPRRRPPALKIEPQEFQPQGLDIQPQAIPAIPPLPPVPPPMEQNAPNGAMEQLAGMGTKRLLALLMKKKTDGASAEDAQDAWEEGGSL